MRTTNSWTLTVTLPVWVPWSFAVAALTRTDGMVSVALIDAAVTGSLEPRVSESVMPVRYGPVGFLDLSVWNIFAIRFIISLNSGICYNARCTVLEVGRTWVQLPGVGTKSENSLISTPTLFHAGSTICQLATPKFEKNCREPSAWTHFWKKWCRISGVSTENKLHALSYNINRNPTWKHSESYLYT